MPDTTPEAVLAAARELKGKRVKVTLEANLTWTGKLVDTSEDGGVELELSGGVPFHGWPLLAIEEVRD